MTSTRVYGQQKIYDVIVIGGGIQGVGVAQAAAAAGYSVLLLEQFSKLAQGSSSRSSKLIHGGLRYLETGQFSLVRECLRERALLLKNAPHLVKTNNFYFPVYRQSRHGIYGLFAGLSLYALLGGMTKSNRFIILKKKLWPKLEGLRQNDLTAVFQYVDAQTDDRLLTEAVMRSAKQLGAVLHTEAKVTDISLSNEIQQLSFSFQNQSHQQQARVVVNASGPWVNEVCELVNPSPPILDIDLIKGSHIIIPGVRCKGVYYLEAQQDHRIVFVIPMQYNMLVGTTEHVYQGDLNRVMASDEEIDYLLENVNFYFPEWKLNSNHIISSYAGLRVLPCGQNSSFLRPRDTIIHQDRARQPRLVSLYGGKLTTYRSTAEKVLLRLVSSLPQRTPIADTRLLPLN